MKKLLALLLVLTMLLSMAACGSGSGSAAEDSAGTQTGAETGTEASEEPETSAAAESSDTGEAEVSEESAPAADPETKADTASDSAAPLTSVLAGMEPTVLPICEEGPTYEIWMAAPGTINQVEDLANTNEAFKALQDRTGVKIEFLMANFFTQSEQFNLMAASGNFPAVMNGAAGLYTSGPDAAIEEDIFLNLSDYLEEYAPHYYALIHSDEQLLRDVSTPEGNQVAFYSLYDYEKYGLGDKGYLIREDWLEKLNLDMPTTYDELHNVLTAFRDEMGADEALALPASGLTDFLIGGFGVGSTFYVEDGEVKFGPMEDGFREYLEMLNQWYEEGLLFRDFYSYANELMYDDTAKIGSGRVALFYNEAGVMVSYGDYSDDPDFMLKAIAPVTMDEDSAAYMTEFTPTYADNSRWTITTNCENPEIIIQVADYLYTEEGIELANYGVEGVSFEYVDGQPQYNDLILNNPEGYVYRDAVALHTMDGVGTVYDPLRGAANYNANQLSSWDDWTNANLDYSKAMPSKDLLNVDEMSEYAALYSDIETVLDEAIIKYIIGDFSFDDYEANVIDRLESMNIQRCIDLYQQAYDRYMSR